MPIPVWGWAAAGEKVTITIGASSATATTDADGKWKVSLPAMQADGKTYSLKVVGNNTVTLEDILIGDVWVGSGQVQYGMATAKYETVRRKRSTRHSILKFGCFM